MAMGPGDRDDESNLLPHGARAPMGKTDNNHLSQYIYKIISGGVSSR